MVKYFCGWAQSAKRTFYLELTIVFLKLFRILPLIITIESYLNDGFSPVWHLDIPLDKWQQCCGIHWKDIYCRSELESSYAISFRDFLPEIATSHFHFVEENFIVLIAGMWLFFFFHPVISFLAALGFLLYGGRWVFWIICIDY